MRRLTTTIALAVVLAGLGAYIYFVDNTRDDTADAKGKVFASLKAEDIDDVRIKAEGGESSHLQKTGTTWQVVEPVKADADGNELTAIAGGLANLDIQRVVDENAGDLKQYGLAPARVEIGFRAKGDKEERRVLLGDKTPTGGDLYAALPGQKRVFLVSGFNDTTFNKNTFALRDKSVLKFERDKVERIELARGTERFEFARSGTEWNITAPVAGRGDYGAIEGIVERLNTVQMQGLVEDAGGDLKKYGLDKPSATITLGLGSSRATLLLGGKDNALVYAKDASRPQIFTVAPTVETDLFKDVSDYRRKDLFDARSFTATKVEIARGADRMVFDKTKGKDGKDVWHGAGGKEVDATKMEDLLAKLTDLRAQSFESAVNPALNNPALSVTMTFDEKKSETVSFAKSGDEVFARRGGEPGAAKAEAMPYDDMLKALDAVK